MIKNNEPEEQIKLSLLAYEILQELSLSIEKPLPVSVRHAFHFIQQNLHKNITVNEIASYTGISTTHLNRLFREHVKQSPIDYFIEQKINWAAHMLTQTYLSIKEIAFTVGYEDQLYFSNRFKKIYNISPKEYRLKTTKKNHSYLVGITIPKQSS